MINIVIQVLLISFSQACCSYCLKVQYAHIAQVFATP